MTTEEFAHSINALILEAKDSGLSDDAIAIELENILADLNDD